MSDTSLLKSDFIIATESEEDPQHSESHDISRLERFKEWVKENGLALHFKSRSSQHFSVDFSSVG